MHEIPNFPHGQEPVQSTLAQLELGQPVEMNTAEQADPGQQASSED
ncbi:Uncharacterised protein [Paucimonas lemoignei]|nr:Uncharacterised protein [Paucimonas lemoignei]